MTDRDRNRFGGLQGRALAGAYAQAHAQAFESRCVQKLLTCLGWARLRQPLKQLCHDRAGYYGLRFEDLLPPVSGFPLPFRVVYLSQLSREFASLIFKDFASLPVVRDFPDYLAECGSPVCGLVLPWINLPGGMVLHNAPQLVRLQPGQARVVCRARRRLELVVQPYPDVLKGLDFDGLQFPNMLSSGAD